MRRYAARALALVVLWASFAWAEPQAAQQAVLELIVNGARRGDVIVRLQAGDVWVPLDSLHAAGLVRLKAATQPFDGVEHVSLHAAALPFAYDEAALTLTITAPPAVLGRTTMDLSTRSSDELRYDWAPSAFLNYAPRLSNGRDFEAFAETGVSLGSVLTQTSATYSPEHGAIRLLSSMSYDDRAHLRSAALGDSFLSAGPLGGALTLGGLVLSRNYALDPYLVKLPRLGFTGSTLSPSTVDVYVNDVLVRRVAVDPGEFQLANITPVTGAGTTRYVLRDAYGQEQRLESSYYSSAGVLARGLSEYTYGIGLVRKDLGTRSFRYGGPAAIARHRFGLTDHLTPGVHLEFDASLVNLGAELTLAGAFGEVEMHGAGSLSTTGSGRRGVAGILGYAYQRRGTTLRTVVRATSRFFATLGLGADQPRNSFEQVTSTSQALGGRTTLSSDLVLALSREPPIARFGLRLDTRLTHTVGLNVSVARSQFQLGRWEDNVFSTLTWSLPAQHFAQLSEHTGPNGSDATGQLSRSVLGPTGVGYQLSGSVGEIKSGTVAVQGQAPFGSLSGSYINQGGTQTSLFEGSGGVVLLAGKLHFTRPVSQSFALLRVPGIENVRGYLNNREIGSTDSNGELFVPDLVSYLNNRLSINPADLPMEVQFEQAAVELAPPARGGAVVTFAMQRVRFARGRIVRGSMHLPPPVKYGTLTVQTPAGALSSPLGPNGEFELDGVPEGHFMGQVQSPEGDCSISLDVPAGDAPVQSLGTLLCTPLGDQTQPGARP